MKLTTLNHHSRHESPKLNYFTRFCSHPHFRRRFIRTLHSEKNRPHIVRINTSSERNRFTNVTDELTSVAFESFVLSSSGSDSSIRPGCDVSISLNASSDKGNSRTSYGVCVKKEINRRYERMANMKSIKQWTI